MAVYVRSLHPRCETSTGLPAENPAKSLDLITHQPQNGDMKMTAEKRKKPS